MKNHQVEMLKLIETDDKIDEEQDRIIKLRARLILCRVGKFGLSHADKMEILSQINLPTENFLVHGNPEAINSLGKEVKRI